MDDHIRSPTVIGHDRQVLAAGPPPRMAGRFAWLDRACCGLQNGSIVPPLTEGRMQATRWAVRPRDAILSQGDAPDQQ